jgi:dihydroorotate dehydrogenase
MKLRGIEFENVLGASGVEGFFGEGYWYHKPFKKIGLDFSNMTFVAKTVTLDSWAGNMPLKEDYTPEEFIPSCVKARPFQGLLLNAVDLSNPGLARLLGLGRWQARQKPFWLSVMSAASTPAAREEELRRMVDLLIAYKDEFAAPFGLQINLSCPNTGRDPRVLIGESARVLDIASDLDVPLMPKFSIASAPIGAILELGRHPACDSVCFSNTLPYNWQGYGQKAFGKEKSPLAHMGGGGLSGALLKPLVCEYIFRLRDRGFTRPINGGGGILCKGDVDDYRKAGASSIFLGSVASLRPWRVKGIIRHANSLEWN